MFSKQNLFVVEQIPIFQFTHWSFRTDDDPDDVAEENYFREFSSIIQEGDMIQIITDDGRDVMFFRKKYVDNKTILYFIGETDG